MVVTSKLGGGVGFEVFVQERMALAKIEDVAGKLGLKSDEYLPYGKDKAKLDLGLLDGRKRGAGRLILVSAINPTPAGEGKTTTSVGLSMGLEALGKKSVVCLREPSLGPVFGIKGGGTGGGKAQLEPADVINLHFTGDIHAISSAHNLLAAMVDNELHFGGQTNLDARRTTWGRVLDMNDRALRNVMVGLGGRSGGLPRETRFDITAASEIMAILCLANSPDDLIERLGRIEVGVDNEKKPVTARDIGAHVAMAALLREALMPNLAQTSEGGPAIVHGGPFANIAHGCSSVIGTKIGMQLADYVVTEAGFGMDLGAEKFLNIKCRSAGIWPHALVLVATLRALKFHGGADKKVVGEPNKTALEAGFRNLDQHLSAAKRFGLPVVVAINHFQNDQEAEIVLLRSHLEKEGVGVVLSKGFAQGSEGTRELASAVVDLVDTDQPPVPSFAYDLEQSYEEKVNAIARWSYGAEGAELAASARTKLKRIQKTHPDLPVCMAKTPLSVSDDPKLRGKPDAFTVNVRDVRLSAGAGFVVALCGDVMTMPGLPRIPAAVNVQIESDGKIKGLMQAD